MEISKRPRPTTVKPMTEPAEKATRRPRFSPSRQALAVRQLALVAMRIPIKPERPEKKPPVMNAKGTNQVSRPVAAMMHSTTNIQAKKIATIVYWRFRYALAPSRMDAEIFCIKGVPSSNFRTFFAVNRANSSAMTEPRKVKRTRTFSMLFLASL